MWLNRFALTTAAATLALLFAGGLVTSTASGDSVPDWPLSYGSILPKMVGGVRIEHSHRMVATTVGILTIVLAAWLWKRDRRPWARKLGVAAVIGVCLQGALGGMRVYLFHPTAIAIIHACVAQAFFGLVVALAVVTSRAWEEDRPSGEASPLPWLAWIATGSVYIQTILGAVKRHTGAGLNVHAAFAGVVSIALIAACVEALRRGRFQKTAVALLGLLAAQVGLGIWSYLLVTGGFVRSTTSPWVEIAGITGHLAIGGLIYALSLALAVRSTRVFRPAAAPRLEGVAA